MKLFRLLYALYFSISLIQVNAVEDFDVELTKKEISVQLSTGLVGYAQAKPFLLLIGGYPGAGKTTLINGLLETQDIKVVSWNAIRQALLDRGLKGSDFDWEIIETVYQNMLRKCFEQGLSVVINANAYANNIRLIENFLKAEKYDQMYQIIKICLNPPVEILYKRICAREQKIELHQGTEIDLRNDLASARKKIDFNDYALILDTHEISLETELKIVNSFLESYMVK
jgi:cytidylate kinase